jgi:hypothetical protein
MTFIKSILTVIMLFTTASAVTLTIFTSGGIAYGQEEIVQSTPASNQSLSQGFFIETVPFSGKLLPGTILPLFEFPTTGVENDGDAHVTIKVPCYDNGTSKVTLMVGVKPDFRSVELERIAENGTLDGEPIPLYITGYTCLYHADIPAGTADIALLNTSNETLAFDADGGLMQLTAYG